MSLPIREVKPKSAKTKRYLDNKAPQVVENPKTTLFLRYSSCSEITQLVLKDLNRLKEPLTVKFNKKNDKHPFEDATSFEFWADKNDTSLMVYGSHSKKRPHCLTLIRTFGYKVLDMLELLIDPETFRSLSQFKNAKATVGLKPLLSFSGSAFESPIQNEYTMAKSLLLDLFKGPDTDKVDVEGLKYMIHFTVDEEEQEGVKPQIHMRCYLLSSRKGQSSNLPKIAVEEMGPRIDFRVGRKQDADPEMLKEAMRKPKTTEAKPKKNIETDMIGDKIGRIHTGRQDLSQLQTRKMKGLKRSRDVPDDSSDVDMSDDENGGVPLAADKRLRVEA
ncbi:hypothetical protein CKM354_000406200 [Cercospora kikuchii]|uniref:Ribosome production factor 2 homolog n=1 Tax=Cercospora kikuchii TaxID=84275 RepID=A0A9P3CAS3_9PEZI|nr:rRNA-binding ribosome biosynthesis protein RPF2 [Cercospora kikuchii]GIZ40734.1 hypothetical protein CKM354_000406200 [Cercospora kikuchii]